MFHISISKLIKSFTRLRKLPRVSQRTVRALGTSCPSLLHWDKATEMLLDKDLDLTPYRKYVDWQLVFSKGGGKMMPVYLKHRDLIEPMVGGLINLEGFYTDDLLELAPYLAWDKPAIYNNLTGLQLEAILDYVDGDAFSSSILVNKVRSLHTRDPLLAFYMTQHQLVDWEKVSTTVTNHLAIQALRERLNWSTIDYCCMTMDSIASLAEYIDWGRAIETLSLEVLPKVTKYLSTGELKARQAERLDNVLCVHVAGGGGGGRYPGAPGVSGSNGLYSSTNGAGHGGQYVNSSPINDGLIDTITLKETMSRKVPNIYGTKTLVFTGMTLLIEDSVIELPNFCLTEGLRNVTSITGVQIDIDILDDKEAFLVLTLKDNYLTLSSNKGCLSGTIYVLDVKEEEDLMF